MAIRDENTLPEEEETKLSRFQRLLAMAGVGLLGAIGVTGVMAGPGGVLGGGSPGQSAPAVASADITTPDSVVAASEDSPDSGTEVVGDVIECPCGESINFKFEQSATEFEVTGTLVSFDGTTVVVTGPDGDVTAAVDPGAEVKGDPQTGDAVKVEGSVLDGSSFVAHEIKPACEPAADVSGDQGDNNQADDSSESGDSSQGDAIPCPAGENTQAKFEQDSHEFELTGALVSFDGTTIVVTGPDGDVTAVVDPSAEIKGDPQPADVVKVEGAVLDDGSLVAREIEPACEAEDDSESADDSHDANDDSSSSGDEQSGDDHSSDSNHDSSHDEGSHDSSGPSHGDHGEED